MKKLVWIVALVISVCSNYTAVINGMCCGKQQVSRKYTTLREGHIYIKNEYGQWFDSLNNQLHILFEENDTTELQGRKLPYVRLQLQNGSLLELFLTT